MLADTFFIPSIVCPIGMDVTSLVYVELWKTKAASQMIAPTGLTNLFYLANNPASEELLAQ